MDRRNQRVPLPPQFVIEQPDELEAAAAQIVESVKEQMENVANPLGRIVVMDALSRALMPEVYQVGMEATAEFRQQGGTWRQIGDELGVTPQAAQQRLDPQMRKREAERSERNRRKAYDALRKNRSR